MKFFMAALLCLMVSTACMAYDRVIPPSQLPKAAKLYIQKNFRGQRIAYAEVDWDHGYKKYEVRLMNGVELKFDGRGNCYKIDYDDDYYRPAPVYGHPHAKSRVIIRYGDDDDDDYWDD